VEFFLRVRIQSVSQAVREAGEVGFGIHDAASPVVAPLLHQLAALDDFGLLLIHWRRCEHLMPTLKSNVGHVRHGRQRNLVPLAGDVSAVHERLYRIPRPSGQRTADGQAPKQESKRTPEHVTNVGGETIETVRRSSRSDGSFGFT
jgi:hypothetical protein